ncbi:MAG: class II aldolase/adducin family protein [Alphaproteobacteria bacterium]|nr:class II aldolase/adducin family protein [Alphaproteobacteria bacterium]
MTDADARLVSHDLARQTLPDEPISAAEWQVRRDLAAAYQLCARFGWDDLVYTHLSARVPGVADRFLLNPFGLSFAEVTADNLVKIDGKGRLIGSPPYGVNAAGFTIHAAVHDARPEIDAVIHLHTEAGMSLSMLAEGLLPLSQHALRFYNRIAYHDYEGIALSAAERDRLTASLGSHKAMVLRNHGTLTCGATVAEAFVLMVYLEKSARTQLAALATGRPLTTPTPEVCELTARQFEADGVPAGSREWPALVRMLIT